MADDRQLLLRHNLAELSMFLVSEHTLGAILLRVAELAVASITPAQFAGITMLVDDRVTTQAFTDPTCPEVDQAQYDSGRGPCLEAYRQGCIVLVDSLRDDRRWPEFASAALSRGVCSTLSVPMAAGVDAVGALNFYAGAERVFGDFEVESAQLFAQHAAALMMNAEAYWGARLKSEHLEVALERRQVIDMAKGIIINATGCRPEEAFRLLVAQSQRQNRKLREIAAEIVDDAGRRHPS